MRSSAGKPLPPSSGGGFAPNVNPSLKDRWPGPGEDAEGINTPSADEDVEGVNSTSLSPSSSITVEGNEPGRGKKTDRLRECRRECRRVWFWVFGAGSGNTPFPQLNGRFFGGDPEGRSSVLEDSETGGKLFVSGPCIGGYDADCEMEKEVDKGDGELGEKGPETDRVREWDE